MVAQWGVIFLVFPSFHFFNLNISRWKKGNWGKPGDVSFLRAINGLLRYVVSILFFNALVGIQLPSPVLVTPFIAPSVAIKAHRHGGMEYFSSVLTTTCLHDLDAIY